MRVSTAALFLAWGLLAAGTAVAAPKTEKAAMAPKCVALRDIVSAKSDDGKILTFRLKDGKVLYNHLQGACPTLRYNGFEWVIHGPQEVCERQQSLRVLQTGEVCVLGRFSTEKPKMDSTKKPD